jgi:hypothetical protein
MHFHKPLYLWLHCYDNTQDIVSQVVFATIEKFFLPGRRRESKGNCDAARGFQPFPGRGKGAGKIFPPAL